MGKKAVVLLSGGLDSATCLALAKADGFETYAVSFDYGQRSQAELNAAKEVAKIYATEHLVFPLKVDLFKGSALTDETIDVPTEASDDIPITYVPARNTVFLSVALAWAEVLGARDIFIGANVIDYSGYPDCRPEYLNAFEHTANLGTKAGVSGDTFRIHAPLIELSKSEIIARGVALGVDYSLTVSCYQADEQGRACGVCESCTLRKEGFATLNIDDPTRYIADMVT